MRTSTIHSRPEVWTAKKRRCPGLSEMFEYILSISAGQRRAPPAAVSPSRCGPGAFPRQHATRSRRAPAERFGLRARLLQHDLPPLYGAGRGPGPFLTASAKEPRGMAQSQGSLRLLRARPSHSSALCARRCRAFQRAREHFVDARPDFPRHEWAGGRVRRGCLTRLLGFQRLVADRVGRTLRSAGMRSVGDHDVVPPGQDARAQPHHTAPRAPAPAQHQQVRPTPDSAASASRQVRRARPRTCRPRVANVESVDLGLAPIGQRDPAPRALELQDASREDQA